jgi:hypothetical protein
MARAPVSKTGGWGFEPLHSCHPPKLSLNIKAFFDGGSVGDSKTDPLCSLFERVWIHRS